MMNVRALTAALAIGSIVWAGCATHGAAISAPSAWSAVQALSPDTRVRMTMRWNEDVTGTVVLVEAERIHIGGHAEPNGFNRSDVLKVYVREGRQTAKYRRRGALTGVSAGAVAIASDQGSFGLLLAAYWTALRGGGRPRRPLHASGDARLRGARAVKVNACQPRRGGAREQFVNLHSAVGNRAALSREHIHERPADQPPAAPVK